MKVPQRGGARTVQKAEGLSHQVSRLIAAEIRSGALKPGDRVPSEISLAAQYGVSRTVLREAVASLKHDGVLESRPGRGMVVKEPGDRHAFRFTDVVEHLSAAEANHLYEMRAILEAEAAGLAARRLTAKDAKKIRQHLEEMAVAVRAKLPGDEAHTKFNEAIAFASKNPFLIEFLSFLHGKLRSLARELRLNTMLDPDRAVLVLGEHQEIVRGILARDPALAREATLAHLRKAAERAGLEIYAP